MTISQARLDELWDFADAAASESRLRAAAAAEIDPVVRAELETQVARALGLQERFAEADATLDAIRSDAEPVRVRVALERGRVRNSAGDPDAAAALFREAAAAAASADLAFLRVDALHMLAIVEPDGDWVDEALAVLGDVDDERTLRWRVSLYNNAGWAHFDAAQYDDAVVAFEASRDAATRWGTPQQVRWADEAIAEARAAGADPGERETGDSS